MENGIAPAVINVRGSVECRFFFYPNFQTSGPAKIISTHNLLLYLNL